jgi:hypothetical protein
MIVILTLLKIWFLKVNNLKYIVKVVLKQNCKLIKKINLY